METLPERQDPIKSWLSWFMSGEDVVRYSDLSYVLETIKKDELCWQAAVSLGVHALSWGVWGKTDEERAENLVGRALEPLEALHESLTRQGGQQPLTDEQGRMLFHVRFGLGFLLWVKGDHERAKRALHDMAATTLSWSRGWHRSGGGLLTYTDDIGAGKEVAALVMFTLYEEVEDYGEALYLIEQAADTPDRGNRPLVLAADLLDRWAAKCVASEHPYLEWFPLLDSAGRVLSVCQYGDTSGALPGDCDEASAQFLAYKLGQLAARIVAKNVDKWHGFLFDFEPRDAVFLLVESLLSDCDPQRDWQKAREAYVTGWELTPCCEGLPAEEVGPHTDLYWAMRIGFADKMLERTQALGPPEPAAAEITVVQDVRAIRDIGSSTALRLLKLEQELDQRLPPAKRQIHDFLEQRLAGVWDRLPAKVINALTKAERCYKSGVNDDDAKVWFVKAVEAALHDRFVSPLADFMQQHGLQQIDLPFPPPRGRERKAAPGLRKVNLWEWADLLDTLATPASRDLSALGTEDLRRFMNQHIGPRWPDFGPLAQSLRRVQELRAGSAHFQQAETRLEKEEAELEEIRKLVLGLAGSPSVIVQIYRLLAPSKQS